MYVSRTVGNGEARSPSSNQKVVLYQSRIESVPTKTGSSRQSSCIINASNSDAVSQDRKCKITIWACTPLLDCINWRCRHDNKKYLLARNDEKWREMARNGEKCKV